MLLDIDESKQNILSFYDIISFVYGSFHALKLLNLYF